MKLKDQNQTLTVMFPNYTGNYSGPGTELWSANKIYNRGQQTGSAGIRNLVYAESHIDLSGYAMDYMTFATFETMYQNPGVCTALDATRTTASSMTQLQVIEIVSTTPLSRDEVKDLGIQAEMEQAGMMNTAQNFKQIIYGRYSLYCQNSTLGITGYMQPIQTQGFGSKEPTATDRLYCYRILIPSANTTATDILSVPACRIGLLGRFYHEDEGAYVMRLRRNYLLHQNLD